MTDYMMNKMGSDEYTTRPILGTVPRPTRDENTSVVASDLVASSHSPDHRILLTPGLSLLFSSLLLSPLARIPNLNPCRATLPSKWLQNFGKSLQSLPDPLGA